MESAKDLSNLGLAHEIIMNHNFHLDPDNLPQDRYNSSLVYTGSTGLTGKDFIKCKLTGLSAW